MAAPDILNKCYCPEISGWCLCEALLYGTAVRPFGIPLFRSLQSCFGQEIVAATIGFHGLQSNSSVIVA